MTKEDIIKMAREAGIEFYPSPTNDVRFCLLKNLERFAALVAAHERESVAASSKRDLTCVCGAVWEGEQMVHAPRKREWVGLTDEERNKLWRDVVGWGDPSHDDETLMKALEAKLKEKNGG